MPEEIMIVSVVAIVFGTGLVGLVLAGIYKLIKAKIDQGNRSGSDINPQFFKALGEFKKNTERRLANLEEIAAELEEERYLVEDADKSMPQIEIEEEEIRTSSKKDKNDDGNLKNMLNE